MNLGKQQKFDKLTFQYDILHIWEPLIQQAQNFNPYNIEKCLPQNVTATADSSFLSGAKDEREASNLPQMDFYK